MKQIISPRQARPYRAINARAPITSSLAVLVACAWLAGCPSFPSPGQATPALNETQAASLVACHQGIGKAQAAFVKTKAKALHKCTTGILSAKVAFENGLTSQEQYDAAIAKLHDKCAKGFAKVSASSTKLVDAILVACAEAEALVVGPYDGLRMLAFAEGSVSTLVDLAGLICTETEALVDASAVVAAPRLIELLESAGADLVTPSSVLGEGGFPAIALDPRCPPVESLAGVVPTP